MALQLLTAPSARKQPRAIAHSPTSDHENFGRRGERTGFGSDEAEPTLGLEGSLENAELATTPVTSTANPTIEKLTTTLVPVAAAKAPAPAPKSPPRLYAA